MALTADPPPGLFAAISFAGGRGSSSDDQVCRADRLIEVFQVFGARSRIPMLWVYAENDHFFAPALAQRLKQAFQAGGGRVDFIAAPAFGSDGHQLFSRAGIPLSDSLRRCVSESAKYRAAADPARVAAAGPPLTAPKVLSADGRNAFETYLIKCAAPGLCSIARWLLRLAHRPAHGRGSKRRCDAIMRRQRPALQRGVRRRDAGRREPLIDRPAAAEYFQRRGGSAPWCIATAAGDLSAIGLNLSTGAFIRS